MVRTEKLPLANRLVAFVIAHSPTVQYPSYRKGRPENCASYWLDWAWKFQSGEGTPDERRRDARYCNVHAEGVCDALIQTTNDDPDSVVLARATLRHDVARYVWFWLMNPKHEDSDVTMRNRREEVFAALRECRRLKAFQEI